MTTVMEPPVRRPSASAARPASGQAWWMRRPGIWALQAIPFVLLLLIWFAAADRIDDDRVMPSPPTVLDAMGELIARGVLPGAAQTSFTTLLIGSAITIVVVVPLAMLLALSPWAAGLIQPMVRFISNVPAIALIPLFIVWFGFSQQAVFATVLYTAAIPLLFSVLTGAQKIPTVYANGLKPLGAGTLHTVRTVYLPGSVPGIVVGIRLAIGYGWRAVVAGELIVGSGGLGELLSRARSSNQVDEIVAVMIVIAVLFLVIDRLFLYPWDQVIASRWSSL
jgi:ABC-type nitrate/sulfonate/bicarbonate transport system permease component